MKYVDFYLNMEKFKKTKRYIHDVPFTESDTDHSFMVTLFALDLMEKYDLGVDKHTAMCLALLHDVGEFGMDFDFAAPDIKEKNLGEMKKDFEMKNVKSIAHDYSREYLLKYFIEYEENKTRESKFIKFVDKFEAMCHMLGRGYGSVRDFESAACSGDEFVGEFPELLPMYRELKAAIKTECEKRGQEWKPEWDV